MTAVSARASGPSAAAAPASVRSCSWSPLSPPNTTRPLQSSATDCSPLEKKKWSSGSLSPTNCSSASTQKHAMRVPNKPMQLDTSDSRSPRSSRGERWGEGLFRRMRNITHAVSPPHPDSRCARIRPLPASGARCRGLVRKLDVLTCRLQLFLQIVAVGFRDDLPAVGEFHRHQIVGEIAWRQLAADLDEGGGFVGAVDGDDKILARLAFGLGRGPLSDQAHPIRHGENLQLALFHHTQVGCGMEDRAQLVGIAFIERVEIVLDHGFDGGTVMAHGSVLPVD